VQDDDADYAIRVTIAQDSFMPAARAAQVIIELQSAAEIKRSVPSLQELETLETVRDLVLAIASDKTAGELTEVIRRVADIEQVELYQPPAAGGPAGAEESPIMAGSPRPGTGASAASSASSTSARRHAARARRTCSSWPLRR